jgi:two-component system nitrogen regulation response regulator GlnG
LEHFRQQIASQFHQAPFSLAPEAEALWLAYGFPGNVRELRNIVIRLATRHAGQTVDAASLREEFDPTTPVATGAAVLPDPGTDDREALIEYAGRHLANAAEFCLDATLLRWEDAYIETARRLANGNTSQAARLLGINRTTLYNRLDTLARGRAGDAADHEPPR